MKLRLDAHSGNLYGRSPCGERGLKLNLLNAIKPDTLVAPRAGSVG